LSFSAEIYPAGNKIAGWLYQGAQGAPDRVLVHSIEQEKSITWGQMAALISWLDLIPTEVKRSDLSQRSTNGSL